MQRIEPDRLLCRKADIVGAQISDGYVMLDLDRGKYLQFNAVAETVWALLETPKSFATLVELLKARFDVTSERCAVEVGAFLERLLVLNLVRYQDGPALVRTPDEMTEGDAAQQHETQLWHRG